MTVNKTGIRTNIRMVQLGLVLFASAALQQVSIAQIVTLDESQTLDEKRSGWLPYIFSTDSLDTSIGVGGFTAGTIQPQASLFGTGFITANESALLSGAANNFQLGDSRLVFDGFLLLDHFTDQRFYADLDRDPNQPRAGSNDSDEDDFVTGESDEFTLNLTLKYPLPIGAHSPNDDPFHVYTTREGLLLSEPTGGKKWNPRTSGLTTFATQFFYTYRNLSNYEVDAEELEAETNGLSFWLEYDNTDFKINPSYGSRQQLIVSRDFGWGNSSNDWTNIQFDAAKYYNLGVSDWFKQKVLALNFWTANTPTWETDPNNPSSVTNRPPPSYGSELGGYDRMRAYPSGRFHDKSAVYYAAEMRFTPQFQQMRDWPIINYFDIDWFQIVPFIEAGRVGPEYNSDLFVKDLKVDAGIGLRMMAYRAVIRLDFAVSEEGASAWAMISQPFSRFGG